MHRATLSAGLAVFAAVGAAAVPAAIATASPAHIEAMTTLAGSAARVTSGAAGVGAVAGTERKTIELWMAGDQRAAQRFVDAVSTPGSPSYHRFLGPRAYTERFGPSPAQVRAVKSYLTGAGFTRVHASVNDDYVAATAPVSTINRAFSVQMRRYRVAGADGKPTTIESNDRELTVPASIGSAVLAITGLNTTQAQPDTPIAAAARAKASACSRYWAQKPRSITPPFRGLTEAAAPVCGYSAKQIRAAYGLTSADTGAGKTIAIIQVGAPNRMFNTLTRYAKVNGLPAPRSGQYREEVIGQGGRSCVNGALEEAALDSEAAYAMAPRANQLMIDGDECDKRADGSQAQFNALLAPLTGKGSSARAAIESSSYGLNTTTESSTPRSQLQTFHAIALRAAAEGVSLLVASGDNPGIEPPASDPDITAVGGTTLGVGARNQRLFETGWSTAFGERTGDSGPWHDNGIVLAASGGVSAVYGEPGYQKDVVPSSMALNQAGKPGRTVPDIAADADPASGMRFGLIVTRRNGKTTPYSPFRQAGTSTSAPLVAGMVADAEQGRRKNLGFLNPLLYSLAGSRAFHDILPLGPSDPQVDRAFYTRGETDIDNKFAPGFLVGVNDVQDPNGTHQVTAPGYDTMTGLGTPNGAAFINGLRSATKQQTRHLGRSHHRGRAMSQLMARTAKTEQGTTSPSGGFSPHTVQRAYGVLPLLREGVDGRGETVVLPETSGGGATPIRQDLAAFDRRYHLPRVDLTLSRALGFTGDSSLADFEEVQDAEMVHAIAPAAKIAIMLVPLRVFADPPELASLLHAAAQRGNVVSFSQSECELESCLSAGQLRSLDRALRYARDRHVSIFASSGDTGAAAGNLRLGVAVPASSALVTGVGGTTLSVLGHGRYGSESVWTDNIGDPSSTGARLSATGGGVSVRYVRPGYQNGLPVIGDHRGVPDVAAMAQPGMATVQVRDRHERISAGGGTSESAPLWAGIAALADQDAHRQLGFLNPGLYRIGHSSLYHRAFRDITHGNNTVTLPSGKNIDGYRARPGWDPVTGWGSPNAQVLVPLLAKDVHPDDGRRR